MLSLISKLLAALSKNFFDMPMQIWFVAVLPPLVSHNKGRIICPYRMEKEKRL